MSTMADTKPRRTRRSFTDDFKAGAVRLVLDEGKTVGRRGPRPGPDGVVAAQLGRAGAGGSHQGQDGPDDRRARGAGAAAQRESRAPGGARHPKKSRGLLREAEPMRFAFIAAEKAAHTDHHPVSVSAGDAERLSTPGDGVRNRSARADDRRLTVLVRASFDASRQRYGSPRIHEDLHRAARSASAASASSG